MAFNAKVIKEISADKMKRNDQVEGKYPWCDMYHNDPWYATEADVFWAEIHIKELLNLYCQVSLHDFYECLRNDRGCNVPNVPNEEDLIWDADILAYEYDSCNICFSNLYDETIDGGRLYTLDFLVAPYPSKEIERLEKEYYGG